MPQYLHHHLKLHHLHFTEVNELYISLSLQAFSTGLVGIFVPIYIYNLGFSLYALSGFYIITAITLTLAFPIVAHLVMRKGPKHIIMLSYILMFFYIALLYLLPSNKQLFFPSAVMGGIAGGLFWMARHIDIATIVSEKQKTSQVSTLLIFLTIAQALAPLLGGVLATLYGIEYALFGACIGLLLAIYPLLKTPEPVVPQKRKINLLRTAPVRHMIANMAMNAQGSIAAYQWPLFIYLVVRTYQDVGIITSASLLLVVITLHVLGRMGDQGKNSEVLKLGSGLRFVVHLGRTLTRSFTTALGVNILGDFTDTLTSLPYAARFYEGARHYDIYAYLTDMEIAGNIGKILPWLVFMGALMFFSLETSLIITFVLAALLMPLLRLIEPLKTPEAN